MKILCKKSFEIHSKVLFRIGEYYEMKIDLGSQIRYDNHYIITNKDLNTYEIFNDYHESYYCFKRYFCTIEEMRKLKIKKIINDENI